MKKLVSMLREGSNIMSNRISARKPENGFVRKFFTSVFFQKAVEAAQIEQSQHQLTYKQSPKITYNSETGDNEEYKP